MPGRMLMSSGSISTVEPVVFTTRFSTSPPPVTAVPVSRFRAFTVPLASTSSLAAAPFSSMFMVSTVPEATLMLAAGVLLVTVSTLPVRV